MDTDDYKIRCAQFISDARKHCVFSPESDQEAYDLFEMLKPIIMSNKIVSADVEIFLADRYYIIENVAEKQKNNAFPAYQTPAIFLIYFIVRHYPCQLENVWNLMPCYLKPVYMELGIYYNKECFVS